MTETHTFAEDYDEQALAFARLMWGDAPEGSVIDACSFPVGRAPDYAHALAADPHDVLRVARQQTHIAVNPLSARPPHGRGTKADRIGHVALVVDVDLDDGSGDTGHKTAGRLPTMAEAQAMLARAEDIIGQPCTAAVQSSRTGVHLWWKLSEVVPDAPKTDPLLRGWAALWVKIADEFGVHMDMGAGPACNSAQVLRLPGQLRIKGQVEPYAARLRRWNPDSVLDVSTARECLGALVQKPTTRVDRVTPGADGDRTYEPTDADHWLDAAVRPIDLMEACLMGERVHDTRWLRRGSDAASSVEQMSDGTLVVSSDALASALGITPRSASKAALSSSSMLSRVILGDWGLAQQLTEYLRAQGQSVLDWVEETCPLLDPTDGDLAAWQQANRASAEELVSPVVLATMGVDTQVAAVATTDEQELMDLLCAPKPRSERLFTVTADGRVREGEHRGTWLLRVGGRGHGTYRLVTKKTKDHDGNEEEETTPVLLSTAIMARIARHELLRTIGDDAPTSFDVVVVGPGGRSVVRDLTPERSLDIRRLLSTANVGGTEPDLNGQRELRNLMLNLGLGSQTRRISYGRSGWSDEDGVLRYITDGNSYSSSGIDREVRVDVPLDDVVTQLNDEMPSQRDFELLPELISEAMEFTRGAPAMAAALIMQGIAGPVRVTGPNAVLWIPGKTGSGKTRVAYLTTMWAQGGRGVPWERPVLDFKKMTSQAPNQAAMRHGDAAVLFDDIRIGGNDGEVDIRTQMRAGKTIIGLVHDRRGRAVAGADQRLRSGGTCDASAVITAEVVFPGGEHSLTAKMVTLAEVRDGVTVDFGMIPLREPDGTPVLGRDGQQVMRYRANAYFERWATLANRIFTGWIAHLHGECLAVGDIRAWAVQNEDRRQDVMRLLPQGRTEWVVGRLLAAWEQFCEWVKSVSGVELPDFWAHGKTLLEDAVEAVTAQTEETALTSALRDALDTQRGHLASGEGGAPRGGMATQMGWADRGGQALAPCGNLLGWVSDDGRWVIMSTSHAKALVPHSTAQALSRTLTSLAPEGEQDQYAHGSVQHSRAGWGRSRRGWKISTAALGLDLGDDLPDAGASTSSF
ncbi:hypothetical protein AAEX63_01805 [Luteococcus sp. H138]|uniref:hypothetical protein n=1 Tax=Luteococcus sp. H138 TaxID=3139404 RepID=UPI00313B9639